jgi:ribosomal-protein-alanine N-acetyltransferase
MQNDIFKILSSPNFRYLPAKPKTLEEFIIAKTDITRIEMRIAKQNKASQRVAVKGGYNKEGILAQMLFIEDKCFDCYLYSKIV